MVSLIQPSFARGIISPALYGRVDTAAYQVSLRAAKNLIIAPQGGAYNRPGKRFLAPFRYHNKQARLVRFQFKTTDSYVLEFGDLYMRVMRNDAHVVDTTFTVTNITNANPAVMTVSAGGLGDGREISLTGVVGMTQVNGRRFVVNELTATTFELIDQLTGQPVNSVSYGAYTSGGSAARIYEISTPYSEADLPSMKFQQSADVMTITLRGELTYSLTRTGHAAWTLAATSFKPWALVGPINLTATPAAAATTTYAYTVTAHNKDTGEESYTGRSLGVAITAVTNANPGVFTLAAHGLLNNDFIRTAWSPGPGGAWQAEFTGLGDAQHIVSDVTTNTFTLRRLDGTLVDTTSFGAYPGGLFSQRRFVRITNGAATADNTISWDQVTDANSYSVYKFQSGVYGFIGTAQTNSFRDNNIAPNLSKTPPQISTVFATADDSPNCSGFYQQRQVFGGPVNAPDTSQFSRVGQFRNMTASSPILDDDAFAATLNSGEVNEIRHYVALSDLLVFTSGGEFRTNSGQDSAFSALSIKQKLQSNWGCSDVPPLVAGSTALFVVENGAQIRSFGYKFEIDGYDGSNLLAFAPHLLKNRTVKEWAYAFVPDPRVFIVCSDGAMLTLTFDQEQQVVAWTDWQTNGFYETVCSLRNPSGTPSIEHGVYFGVRRTLGGATVRYIEKQASRTFTDIRDAFFVDSGLSYDSPVPIDSLTFGATTTVNRTAHGFTDGQQVELSDILWEQSFDEIGNAVPVDQLNYGHFLVANATANAFEITDEDGNPIDSSGYVPRVSGGNIRRRVTTISGLEHLAGRTVSALVDGNAVLSQTISSDGVFTVPAEYAPAARVHIGLQYISDLETLNIEVPSNSIQTLPKLITQATIRFEQTRGLLFGPHSGDLVDMLQRMDEPFGAPTEMLTGDKIVTLPAEWNSHGRMFLRQIYPLPQGILAVMPELHLGER